jgi:glycosyltransferase involved in cell wall biosynthesis
MSYLRQSKPYALIAAPDHANLIAVWARLLAGVKTRTVITTHNTLSIVVRQRAKLQEKLYPILLRLFQGYATHIVAVSQGAAEDLAHTAHIPRCRISVIYNPAVRTVIRNLSTQSSDLSWSADDVPFILAVGRLSPQKDYPTLLKAFARLRGTRHIRLLILGEGEERNKLDEQIKSLGLLGQVFMPGFVKNPYALMARCRVFVLSSAWEGFSMVIAEALYCGAQVVSTDCPSGPAEILENGRYGRLVPVGDDSALANALEDALDHPMPVESLKARAAIFSVDVAVDGYLKLLGLV